MKFITYLQSVKPEGNVTIDGYSDEFQFFTFEEVIENRLPYTRIFANINIVNFTQIPAVLLSKLTNQYLHGATIYFKTPARKFEKCYASPKPSKFCTYKWAPLDLSAPVPKSLAQFEFMYRGNKVTYLDAIRTLTSTRYIPNEIWTALDDYSQGRIEQCRKFNQGNYTLAETWFKELTKDAYSHGIKVYSPNSKTYFEAMAELDFEKKAKDFVLPKGVQPLNESELLFLQKYAPAYGVEIPQLQWRYNSRHTRDGYTEEPEWVYSAPSTSDWNKVIYDPRNFNLPKTVRNNLSVKSRTNDKLLRDAYYQLTWLITNLGDEALLDGYKRCPECGEIYYETVGCDCGFCKPVHFYSAENLFYGNASAYEDRQNVTEKYTKA